MAAARQVELRILEAVLRGQRFSRLRLEYNMHSSCVESSAHKKASMGEQKLSPPSPALRCLNPPTIGWVAALCLLTEQRFPLPQTPCWQSAPVLHFWLYLQQGKMAPPLHLLAHCFLG